jgi:hypothetical protein
MNEINFFIVSQNSVPEYNGACRTKSQLSITWNGKLDDSQGGWDTVAPSAVAYHHTENAPLELHEAGIQK